VIFGAALRAAPKITFKNRSISRSPLWQTGKR